MVINKLKNKIMIDIDVIQKIEDGDFNGSILEAKNYIKDAISHLYSRVDDIDERVKNGEDEYNNY